MTETETKLQADLAAKDKKIAELETKLSQRGGSTNGSAPVSEFAKSERELCDLLLKGPRALSDLPKHLQDDRFLLYMVRSNQVEFGRPPHYFNHAGLLMPGDGETSWTNCSGHGVKPLPELLAEERQLAAENKLERTALIPKDFGGDMPKDQQPKQVPVNIKLQVRLRAA